MFALALLSLFQAEPMPTVFDLALGEPVTLPECAFAKIGGGQYSPSVYAAEQDVTCQTRPGVEHPKQPNSGAIIFASLKAPWFLASPRMETVVVDGRLEGIYAKTMPISSGYALSQELIAKFGSPTQNGVQVKGPGLVTLRMSWDRPAFTVEYVAPTSKATGDLRIETNKARALRLGASSEADAERTRL